ncbi:Uracil-regulated protein 1 [Zancudomyces culisetae]|uniref:Uracil-regulated protein 1 n=1 Tax=Zancudomyces culisetae TaxID=1213189 RepID=A0A1R1PX56_ZANCU|nr:Uracil-regulated protein 1 [Zancudomyces culisetae]|eukprot:OMH85570.1 Uracil-regulated protein 1 [Zancudomyces culisetae]
MDRPKAIEVRDSINEVLAMLGKVTETRKKIIVKHKNDDAGDISRLAEDLLKRVKELEGEYITNRVLVMVLFSLVVYGDIADASVLICNSLMIIVEKEKSKKNAEINTGDQIIKSVEDGKPIEPFPSRVVLTTYPGQSGVRPIPLKWGAPTPLERGPIVVSRAPELIGLRNAIGAHGGSYCIYKALAVAVGAISPNHKPDFTNTQPLYTFGPNKTWSDPEKIVSLDPWGHMIVSSYGDFLEKGVDIKPSIAVTKANLRLAEIDDAVKAGRLVKDGTIITENGDIRVSKAAIEPVWHLKGVSKRFGISEKLLRRALFEDTGGMYPELITRPDMEVFLPPIGGITVYIFGDPEKINDEITKLTIRVHDECNGSDVFGSDICTCRPYLIYGIEEAIKQAQEGGVGMSIYFRKEGRALGEVTKYLVYNARKRQDGGDTAATYFQRTECIAGVKDMRFQALMPDVLHWMGIKKIDRFVSMSNMKYDAIVDSGISILERVDIPPEMIPNDSNVEIQAKIASGYFSSAKPPTTDDLVKTKGREWE